MNDYTITSALDKKVAELIEKYKFVVSENERLLNELTQSKAKCEAQTYQINRLEEELLNKNLKDEEIERMIEQVIGNNN
ncbi:hypothetical protein [Campylobacter sp. MG1]|uniref:hypothetical protein n=1 Tax=Campylobacter sp. MG1 TaxID=2976332 RepID=UPI00226C87B8|nr:hypothetical protein [Campylobacter sp. MG1]